MSKMKPMGFVLPHCLLKKAVNRERPHTGTWAKLLVNLNLEPITLI